MTSIRSLFLLIFLLAAPVLALPSGTYLLSDYKKETRIFAIVEVAGEQVLLSEPRSPFQDRQEGSLKRVSDDQYTLTAKWDYSEPQTFYVVKDQDNWLVVFPYRDSDERKGSVLRLTRVQDFPEWLNGTWNDESGATAYEFRNAKLSEERDVYRHDFEPTGYAYSNESQGPRAKIFLRDSKKQVQVMKLSGGQVLLWDPLDGQSQILTPANR